MTGAMNAAIAGLKTHMDKMNVIGNNIANVNTAGYKTQRTIFKDAMYTTYSNGSNGTDVVGGKNPAQIGYGSQVSTIDLNMASGSFTPGRATDCTIDGDGFFLVGDKNIQIESNDPNSLKSLKLTRVGDFEFKADGYLCDGNGNPVYGFLTTGVNPDTGMPIVSDQLVPIRLPRAATMYRHPDGTVDDKAEPDTVPVMDVKYPSDVKVGENPKDPQVPRVPLHDYQGTDIDAPVDYPYVQMDSISIDPNTGAISGTTKDGNKLITIGYLAIGNVTNPGGVSHTDGFYYTAGDGAGDLQVSMLGGVAKELNIQKVNGSLYLDPDHPQSDKMTIGSAGGTKLLTGGLEGSNVDLAVEIAEMITTQRGYQANTRIITVTDAMLEELVNIKR